MRKVFVLLTILVFGFWFSCARADEYIQRSPSPFTFTPVLDLRYITLNQSSPQTIVNGPLRINSVVDGQNYLQILYGGVETAYLDNYGFGMINGTAATPSYGFYNSGTAGMYLISDTPDHLGFSVDGLKQLEVTNGTFNFQSGNLTTTGSVTATSFIIGANTLTTSEWAFLDGQDQAVKTTSSPQFANLKLTGGGGIYPSADSTTALGISSFAAPTTKWVTFDTTNKIMTLSGRGIIATSAAASDLTIGSASIDNPQKLQFLRTSYDAWNIYLANPSGSGQTFAFYNSTDGKYTFLMNESNGNAMFSYLATPPLATARIHQDDGTGVATYHKFTAGTTTGTASTDGFNVGIDASGNAELRQREALPLIFYTNNTEVGRFSSGGNLTLLAGTDIRPTADSTTAINIANAAGTDFVTFDTTNKRLGLNCTPTVDFQIGAAGGADRTFNIYSAGGAGAVMGSFYTQPYGFMISSTQWMSMIAPGGYEQRTGGSIYYEDSDAGNVTRWQWDSATGLVTQTGTLSFPTTNKVQFRDSAIHIESLDDGHLDLTADTSIDLHAPTVSMTDPIFTATTTNSIVNNAKFDMIEDLNNLIGTTYIKGFWVFDQTGATTSVTDRSPNSHTLTLGGNASTLSPAVSGLCPNLALAGTAATSWTVADNNDFSFCVSGVSDTAFSLIVLCNPTNTTSDKRIIGKLVAGQEEYQMYWGGTNTLTFLIAHPNYAAYLGRNYSANLSGDVGGWHCYIATYDGSSTNAGLKLYRDGVQVDDGNVSSGAYTAMTNGTSKVANSENDTGAWSSYKAGVSAVVGKELTAAEAKRISQRLLSYAGSFQ